MYCANSMKRSPKLSKFCFNSVNIPSHKSDNINAFFTIWILRCGRAASPVWREPPVRTNGATPFCLLSYFAIAESSPYTSLIERSLDGSTLSISIL